MKQPIRIAVQDSDYLDEEILMEFWVSDDKATVEKLCKKLQQKLDNLHDTDSSDKQWFEIIEEFVKKNLHEVTTSDIETVFVEW